MKSDRAYVPWVVLGAGRLGQAVARLGVQLGIDVRALWNRSDFETIGGIPSFSGDLFDISDMLSGSVVWVTVADEAIEAVSHEAAVFLGPADIMLHCSGSLDSSLLRRAGAKGPVASLHPLLSIADPKQAVDALSECVWTVEGDFPAVAFARWMLGRMGTEPIEIEPENKVLYHAAAVTSAGLLDALMDVAFSIADTAGFSPEQAREMLIPLAQSTLENLKTKSNSSALTGPLARGDEAVIIRHLAALEDSPDDLEVYRVLTHRARHLKD